MPGTVVFGHGKPPTPVSAVAWESWDNAAERQRGRRSDTMMVE
jgi:hypothetical protein